MFDAFLFKVDALFGPDLLLFLAEFCPGGDGAFRFGIKSEFSNNKFSREESWFLGNPVVFCKPSFGMDGIRKLLFALLVELEFTAVWLLFEPFLLFVNASELADLELPATVFN